MAIVKAGARRTECCDWCDERAEMQLVTSYGIVKRSCHKHIEELKEFNELRKIKLAEADDRYKLRESMRYGCEQSIAEFELGVR